MSLEHSEFLADMLHKLPLYGLGFGWVPVAVVMLAVSFGVNAVSKGTAKSEQFQLD